MGRVGTGEAPETNSKQIPRSVPGLSYSSHRLLFSALCLPFLFDRARCRSQISHGKGSCASSRISCPTFAYDIVKPKFGSTSKGMELQLPIISQTKTLSLYDMTWKIRRWKGKTSAGTSEQGSCLDARAAHLLHVGSNVTPCPTSASVSICGRTVSCIYRSHPLHTHAYGGGPSSYNMYNAISTFTTSRGNICIIHLKHEGNTCVVIAKQRNI
jgi:hypothetical protein